METISLFFKICCKEKEDPRVGWKQLKAWRRSRNSQYLRRLLSAQSLDTRVLEDIEGNQGQPFSQATLAETSQTGEPAVVVASQPPQRSQHFQAPLCRLWPLWRFFSSFFFCSLPPPISIRYTTKIKLASQSLLPSVVAITHPTTATSKYSWHASEPSELAWFTSKMLIKQLNAGSLEAIMNSGSILFLDWLEMNMGSLMNQPSSWRA